MPQLPETLKHHPSSQYTSDQIHDGVYLGSHATKLVAGVDVDTHNYTHGFSDDAFNPKTEDEIWHMKQSGEFGKIDEDYLYNAAPRIAKELWFNSTPYDEEGYQEWEYAKPFKTWLSDEATKQQFINVFQSVMHEMSTKAQDPRVVEKIKEKTASYMEGLRAGQSAGWLAPGSAERVAAYTEGDKEWKWGVASGGMRIGIPAWAISPNIGNESYIPQVVFNGGISGMGYDLILPEEVEARIEESGYHEFNHAFLGRFKQGWLNEAVTEHIAQVLKGNVEPDGTGYSEDLLDKIPYGEEVRLLLAYTKVSQQDPETAVTLMDMTHAYSSLSEEEVQQKSDKLKTATGLGLDEMDTLLVSKTSSVGGGIKYKSTDQLDSWWNPDYKKMVLDTTAQLESRLQVA